MKYFYNHQISKITNGVIDSIGLAELIELKKENILFELEREISVLKILPAVRSGEIVNMLEQAASLLMPAFAEEFFAAAFEGGNLASLKCLLEQAGDLEITDLSHGGHAYMTFYAGKYDLEFLEYFEKFLVQLSLEDEDDDEVISSFLFNTQEKIRQLS